MKTKNCHIFQDDSIQAYLTRGIHSSTNRKCGSQLNSLIQIILKISYHISFFEDFFITLASKLKLLNMQAKDLNRLKLVLVEKKRTGIWLAEQLGVSNTTVSKWCSNTSQPTLPTLDKIAVILGCDKRELITE